MSEISEIRTRFAPSPTGYMHVGNLRTALYAYLIAKKDPSGKFILRIEDTDRERYVDGAVEIIYKTLKETGLLHDEGPDIGGPCGPYVQSERQGIYKEYAEKLISSGHAYRCFCTKERLDELKARQDAEKKTHLYDKHCLSLSQEEVEKNLAGGVPFVVRQNVPPEGNVTFTDEIYGAVTVEHKEIDDQILIKSDGYPTYNFANVVDDHLMGITHVIRGTEYLSSSPKYNLLYQAFGWAVPKYIHCPPVMKDQTTKLSKRNGDASYEDLIEAGYLKDAVLNYIALLGWSPGGENEIFSLPELVSAFDVAGISKSPAIFDPEKLRWMSGEYMKRLSPEEFLSLAAPRLTSSIRREIPLSYTAALLQQRCDTLSDIPALVDFIDTLPEYGIELYIHKKMKTTPESSLDALRQILPVLEGIEGWTEQNIHDALFSLIERLGVKNGLILWPLRVALSGKMSTPGGGVELSYLLGKEESLARVKAGIEKLTDSI